MAAKRNHVDYLEVLLSCAEIKVNQPNKVGLTPVCAAASEGHTESLRKLVKHEHLDINAPETLGKRSPAYISAEKNHASALRILVEVLFDAVFPRVNIHDIEQN